MAGLPFLEPIIGVFSAIADLFAAGRKGHDEQSSRQGREARARVADILRVWQKKLLREEARRQAMHGHNAGVAGEEDLELIDCLGFAWQVVEALRSPLFDRRVAENVEDDLRSLIGEDYFELFQSRAKISKGSQSMGDMHAWMFDVVTTGAGLSLGGRQPTPVAKMFDDPTDPMRVGLVRDHVESMMRTVLRY